MAKVVESPVARWPGKVHFRDPLSIPQAVELEAALDEQQKLSEGGEKWRSKYDALFLPVIFGCVEKWELAGFPEMVTPDTFPGTPRKDSSELAVWLIGEIVKIYAGGEVPNE